MSSQPTVSTTFSTTDGESLTDALDAIRFATWSVGQAICSDDPPALDEFGSPISSLSAQVAGVSSAMREIAAALHAIAAAIEAQRQE